MTKLDGSKNSLAPSPLLHFFSFAALARGWEAADILLVGKFIHIVGKFRIAQKTYPGIFSVSLKNLRKKSKNFLRAPRISLTTHKYYI